MEISGSAIFNFHPDGGIVTGGDHSPAVSDGIDAPWSALGVNMEHAGVGDYRISGPGLSWPEGWRITIFRNENDENTVRVALSTDDEGRLRIECVHPETREPMDIIYMMTVRIGVSGAIDYLPPALPDVGSFAPSIGLPDSLSQQADTPAVEN